LAAGGKRELIGIKNAATGPSSGAGVSPQPRRKAVTFVITRAAAELNAEAADENPATDF
jgi:hypothetical protein